VISAFGGAKLQVMTPELIATGLVLVLIVLIRVLLLRVFGRFEWASIEERRSWIVLVRNVSLLVGAFLIMLIWADELRVIGLSLVAVAVAVAISVQDLIKSMVGAFVRATSSSYSIGDRVQVAGIRGQVIDHSLLTTTLIEISPGHLRTGRTITVPNSQFLTEPVVNETTGHEYILHSFHVPVSSKEWGAAMDALKKSADRVAAPYVQPARKQMDKRAKRHALPAPIIEPFVTPRPISADGVELTVRVPVATSDVWRVEHEILEEWLRVQDKLRSQQG
jgi:small-conductance mechanosensitive channel